MTKKKTLLPKKIKRAYFTDKNPKELLNELSQKGYDQATLIGGMKLNTSFLEQDLIDEIFIDVHPLIIGSGLGVFSDIQNYVKKLHFLDYKKLKNDLILLYYKVIK